MDKKKMAIALYTNDKYFFALGTFLINVNKYISNIDNIVIYYENLNDFQKECILKVYKNCIFIEYTIDNLCNDFSFDKEIIKNNVMIKRYSSFIIGKCVLFKLLDMYNTVIWFDVDMIIRNNLDEIINNNTFNIAWANDVYNMKNRLKHIIEANPEVEDKIKNYPEFFDITDQTATPNGGLIILHDNFDYHEAYNLAIKFVSKYFIDAAQAVDELTFAYVAHKMKLNIFYLKNEIYNIIPSKSDINTKIIHFIGSPKPWNNKYMFLLFPQWIDNYRLFISQSGYNDESEKIIQVGETGKAFYEIRNMLMWNELFSTVDIDIPKTLVPIFNFKNHYFVLRYNNFLQYEINFGSAFGSALCLLWIHGKYFQNEYLEYKMDNIIKDNSKFMEKIKRKDSFGAKTITVQWKDINETFNTFYIMTSEIRKQLSV